LDRISVSPHAILTLPTHVILDSISEKSKGKRKIGSTGRGISPSYTDLYLRRALRVGDILDKNFKSKYIELREEHKKTLKNQFDHIVNQSELAISEKKFWEGVNFIKK